MKSSKIRHWLVVAVLSVASAASSAAAESIKAEVDAITASVRAKMKLGMVSEADLALELNQLSDLLDRHRGEKTEQVAEILVTQAMIYADVIRDREMGVVLLKRVKYEYSGTEIAKAMDPLIASIQSGERYKNRR
jgi:hypothetical protein